MPDGSEFIVPAEIVARRYAIRYSDNREEYETELKFMMSEHKTLIDWCENNLNWDDVERHAVLHKQADAVDYQDGWCNGEKEVIEL